MPKQRCSVFHILCKMFLSVVAFLLRFVFKITTVYTCTENISSVFWFCLQVHREHLQRHIVTNIIHRQNMFNSMFRFFFFFNGLQPTSAYIYTVCIVVNHVTFGRSYTAIKVFFFNFVISSFKIRFFCRSVFSLLSAIV